MTKNSNTCAYIVTLSLTSWLIRVTMIVKFSCIATDTRYIIINPNFKRTPVKNQTRTKQNRSKET